MFRCSGLVIPARREPRPPEMKKRRRCELCARSGAWANPLNAFVRCAPFLGAVVSCDSFRFWCHGVLRRAGALATLRLLTRQSSFPNAGRQTSGLPAKTRSERRIRNNHLRVTLASGVNTKMFRPVARDGAFRGPLAVSFSGRLTKWRPPTTQPATSTRCFRTRGLSRRMSTPSR